MKNIITLFATLAICAPVVQAQDAPRPSAPTAPVIKGAPAPVPPAESNEKKDSQPEEKTPNPAK
jgi:hypothetical protein